MKLADWWIVAQGAGVIAAYVWYLAHLDSAVRSVKKDIQEIKGMLIGGER